MMENKIIKTSGGFVWLDVTDKARQIYDSNTFELYHVWKQEGNTHRIFIQSDEDLNYALTGEFLTTENHSVCIEIGNLDEENKLDFISVSSWENADKILHNNHVYVKYADLTFCR